MSAPGSMCRHRRRTPRRGRVRFDVDDSGTLVLITGRFLAIDRPHLLRFTWSNSDWPDPTAVSVVNVGFEPLGDDQTLMSIEHSLLPPEEFDDFQSGWALTCDQLAALLHANDATSRVSFPHPVALPSCIDTGRGANWAVSAHFPDVAVSASSKALTILMA